MKKLSIIIPVYNECNTVEEVIRRVKTVPFPKEIIIVNDGSTDGTGKLLEKYSEDPDIKIVHCEQNSGKGVAVRLGLERASGDLVTFQDADLEYDPGDFPALIEPIEEGRADVVFGSRFIGTVEGMAFKYFLANKIVSFLASLLYQARITDNASCYRVVRTELMKSLHLQCTRFEFEAEMSAKLLKRGVRFVEVPIHYRARTHAEGKKLKWIDAWRHFWTLIKYRFVG